jgi:hypothetical protein
MISGELRSVGILLFTDRFSVWLQEEFQDADLLDVYSEKDESGRPVKFDLVFTPRLEEAAKRGAFGLNADCLVKLGGCKTLDEMLPAAPHLLQTLRNRH